MIGQSGEDVGEPCLRVDIVELACFDQGVDGGGAASSGIGAGEHPVLPPDGHAAQAALGGIVGQADAAIVEETGEGFPAGEAVVDGFVLRDNQDESSASIRMRMDGSQ